MSRFFGRCKIAALLLALALAVPWAAAAQPLGSTDRGLTAPVWRLLEPLWELVSSLWIKNGASADPSGSNASVPPSSWTKNGGSADPDGKPTSQPGTTSTTPTTDAGGSADPNG